MLAHVPMLMSETSSAQPHGFGRRHDPSLIRPTMPNTTDEAHGEDRPEDPKELDRLASWRFSHEG